MRPWLWTLIALALITPGCGAGRATPAETSASFERIQIAEAQIVVGIRAAFDEDASDASRREGATRVCDAAAVVCEEADGLEDADAAVRCARATVRCEEARAAAAAAAAAAAG